MKYCSKTNREKQILVADMDSTLIYEECIDELAKITGLSEKIIEITNRSMTGKISFSDSLIQRTSFIWRSKNRYSRKLFYWMHKFFERCKDTCWYNEFKRCKNIYCLAIIFL